MLAAPGLGNCLTSCAYFLTSKMGKIITLPVSGICEDKKINTHEAVPKGKHHVHSNDCDVIKEHNDNVTHHHLHAILGWKGREGLQGRILTLLKTLSTGFLYAKLYHKRSSVYSYLEKKIFRCFLGQLSLWFLDSYLLLFIYLHMHTHVYI